MIYVSPTSPNPGPAALLDFSFKHFITLSVVKVLYILLLALAGLSWIIVVIGSMIAGFNEGFGAGVLATFMSIIIMTLVVAIQVIVWRVMLELIVVIFRISENTSKLVGGDTSPTGGFPVTPYASVAPTPIPTATPPSVG